MAGTFLKWFVPALVTVAAGTALAVAQTDGALTSDLAAKARGALDPTQFPWASIAIDGRDAVVSGTATTQAMIDDAVARVGSVAGIRSVQSRVALAEFVSPFPFSASLKQGKVKLAGAYPDEAVHAALVAAANSATDETSIHSGAPTGFAAGATFALSTLSSLDEGEVSLADLSLTVSGRAKSLAAFDSLQRLRESAPAGLKIAAITISPPLASPYVWTARFDGSTVAIAGNTPDPSLADKLRAAAPANIPVSAALELASGEPSGFEANALILLKSLLILERGEASIRDGVITLVGAPATADAADQVTAAVAQLGGTATLEPPRITDYALAVDKAGDRFTFSGFVPDATTKDRLAGIPGADITKLSLGRGATDRFASGLDFGLGILQLLGDGRFEIKGDRMSVGGRAATVADFKAAAGLLTQGAPQGLTLVAAALHPPTASPFTWSAVKDEQGRTTLSGFVPDETTRKALEAKVADLAADTADPADGAPNDFAPSAGKGLEILALLDTGTLAFDGANWSIEGTVADTKKGFAADAAYSVAGLRTAGWTYAVHLPAPPAVAPLPTIAPYVWRAQKSTTGTVAFTGFAPAEAFQRVAKGRAPNALDNTALGAGAPPDFGTSALAGLDALLALDEGALGLNGARWTLTGVAPDSLAREAIQNRLTAQIDAASWQIAIQAKDAAPIVTPYIWSATKGADGVVSLDGYVPSEQLRALALQNAGPQAHDAMNPASGEPAGFETDLVAGLTALGHLAEGRVAFDGSKWDLTGSVASQADGDAAVAALAKGSKGGALWTSTLGGYTPQPTEASSASSSSLDITSSVEMSSVSEPAEDRDLSAESSSASEEYPSSAFMEPKAETSSQEPAPAAPAEAIVAVPPIPAAVVFEATRPHGQPLTLKGSVPAAAAAAYLGSVAGDVPTDGLVVESDLPIDFVSNALAGLGALGQLSEGRLAFDGSRWWLRGKGTAEVESDVTTSIATLPNGADWSVAIDLLAPVDVCRDKVDAIAAQNVILFQSGKPALMDSSLPVLDELATDLGICPDTDVHVQAHTDGDGDADANLALSVARAETVVSELIKRGVAEGRLYAEGYGESDPVVENDTKDNKARNRRIAFAITEK